MPILDDSPQQVEYKPFSAKLRVEPYDILVIRDLTGTVARFEKLRGDKGYVEFLDELLDSYQGMKLLEY